MKMKPPSDPQKTNPIQTQFKPNQSQFQSKTNPIKPNSKPKEQIKNPEFPPSFALSLCLCCVIAGTESSGGRGKFNDQLLFPIEY